MEVERPFERRPRRRCKRGGRHDLGGGLADVFRIGANAYDAVWERNVGAGYYLRRDFNRAGRPGDGRTDYRGDDARVLRPALEFGDPIVGQRDQQPTRTLGFP